MGGARDDGFDLHDLRVEVVAPPGARLYCGASVGDWFEVRGEMIHLPPGQGFSLYSLAALLPLLPAIWMIRSSVGLGLDSTGVSSIETMESGWISRTGHAAMPVVRQTVPGSLHLYAGTGSPS